MQVVCACHIVRRLEAIEGVCQRTSVLSFMVCVHSLSQMCGVLISCFGPPFNIFSATDENMMSRFDLINPSPQ